MRQWSGDVEVVLWQSGDARGGTGSSMVSTLYLTYFLEDRVLVNSNI